MHAINYEAPRTVDEAVKMLDQISPARTKPAITAKLPRTTRWMTHSGILGIGLSSDRRGGRPPHFVVHHLNFTLVSGARKEEGPGVPRPRMEVKTR